MYKYDKNRTAPFTLNRIQKKFFFEKLNTKFWFNLWDSSTNWRSINSNIMEARNWITFK